MKWRTGARCVSVHTVYDLLFPLFEHNGSPHPPGLSELLLYSYWRKFFRLLPFRRTIIRCAVIKKGIYNTVQGGRETAVFYADYISIGNFIVVVTLVLHVRSGCGHRIRLIIMDTWMRLVSVLVTLCLWYYSDYYLIVAVCDCFFESICIHRNRVLSFCFLLAALIN